MSDKYFPVSRQSILSLKSCIFLTVTLLWISAVSAQGNLVGITDNIKNTPPEAAAITKMVDIPVSYFSGVPSIEVPLYMIKGKKGINIPVVLKYQAGGIKASEDAGVYGLGWSLDYGAGLSRKIRGNPDEGIFLNRSKVPVYNAGGQVIGSVWPSPLDSIANQYNLTGGWLTQDQDFSLPYLQRALVVHDSVVVLNKNYVDAPDVSILTSGLLDTEPDVYYYTIKGSGGRFCLNGSTPVFIPKRNDINIQYVIKQANDINTPRFVFSSWKLTTPDGLEYYFAENDSAKTIVPNSRYGGFDVSWDVNRIISKDNADTVSFQYLRHTTLNKEIMSRGYFAEKNVFDTANSWISSSSWSQNKTTRAAIINNIKTTTENIDFFTSHYWTSRGALHTKIDSIIIKDLIGGNIVRSVYFRYALFKSDRLKLENLQIKDFATDSSQIYTFNYYDTTFRNLTFNARTISFSQYAQDYWGYYNDALENEVYGSMVPVKKDRRGVSRKSAWPAMQRDALTSITYPTGGRVSFEYEPHKVGSVRENDNGFTFFENYVNWITPYSIDTIGGLRIKRITTYDPVKNDSSEISYAYVLKEPLMGYNFQSSGHLYIPPSMVLPVEVPWTCLNGVPLNRYYVSSENMYDDFSNDQVVSYRYVKVTRGHSGMKNGYEEYYYHDDFNTTDSSFYLNICDGILNKCGAGEISNYPSWLPKYRRMNLLRGELKEQNLYDSTGTIVRRNKYYYSSKVYPGILRALKFSGMNKDEICNSYTIPDRCAFSKGHYAFPPNSEPEHDMESVPLATWSTDRVCFLYEKPSFTVYFMDGYRIGSQGIFKRAETSDTYINGIFASSDSIAYKYESPSHANETSHELFRNGTSISRMINVFASDLDTLNNFGIPVAAMKAGFYNPQIGNYIFKKGILVKSNLSKYIKSGNQFLLTESYNYEREGKLTAASLGMSGTLTYPIINIYNPQMFKKEVSVTYDGGANIIQADQRSGTRAFIWGSRNSQLIASIQNAVSTNVAYTSFENNENGGWSYPVAGTQVQSTPSGKTVYNINGRTITKSNLTGDDYIVSYYSTTGPMSINGSAVYQKKVTVGTWALYEHKISAVTAVSITGTGIVDELRLYPVTSQMETYSFEPGVGMQAAFNVNGLFNKYDYYGMSKLATVRDYRDYVLQAMSYRSVYRSQLPSKLYYSTMVTDSIAKNNCSTAGEVIAYSVPASKYFSRISVFDATVKAKKELQDSLQAYANRVGKCYFLSPSRSLTYMKTGCTKLGETMPYNVDLGKYRSLVSQRIVDSLADYDMMHYGQSYVNSHAACLPTSDVQFELINETTYSDLDLQIQIDVTYPGGGGGDLLYVRRIPGSTSTSLHPGAFSIEPKGSSFMSTVFVQIGTTQITGKVTGLVYTAGTVVQIRVTAIPL
jgi:hypothetical protein